MFDVLNNMKAVTAACDTMKCILTKAVVVNTIQLLEDRFQKRKI